MPPSPAYRHLLNVTNSQCHKVHCYQCSTILSPLPSHLSPLNNTFEWAKNIVCEVQMYC